MGRAISEIDQLLSFHDGKSVLSYLYHGTMTILGNSIVMFLGSSTKIMVAIFSSAKIPISFPP